MNNAVQFRTFQERPNFDRREKEITRTHVCCTIRQKHFYSDTTIFVCGSAKLFSYSLADWYNRLNDLTISNLGGSAHFCNFAFWKERERRETLPRKRSIASTSNRIHRIGGKEEKEGAALRLRTMIGVSILPNDCQRKWEIYLKE